MGRVQFLLVFACLTLSVLEQLVAGREAWRSYYAILRALGEPAPGPRPLLLPPNPEAIALLQSESFQLMVADLRLPGDITGLDLVSLAKQEQSQIASIVITAHGNVESAVEAMRRGALDLPLYRNRLAWFCCCLVHG